MIEAARILRSPGYEITKSIFLSLTVMTKSNKYFSALAACQNPVPAIPPLSVFISRGGTETLLKVPRVRAVESWAVRCTVRAEAIRFHIY